MENVEKVNFFNRLKIALIDLEKYVVFLGERFSKSVLFVFEISFLLAILFATANISYVFIKYNSVENYISEVVPDFSIIEGKIEIIENENKDDINKEVVSIIEQLNENMDFNIVKDGYNKSDFINDVNNNLRYIIIGTFISILIANFMELSIFWFINSIMTAIVGEIILWVTRIKMRFSSIYMLSIYATTLSTILTVVYSIARMYFNVYIDIFDYLYMIISYIYITAVILMIRTELIKHHIEIIKIIENKETTNKDFIKEDLNDDKAEEKEDNKNKEDNKDNDDEKEPDGSC